MYPRRVVAWKAKFPGDVFRLYFILRASRMLHVKKGTQHTRNLTGKKYLRISDLIDVRIMENFTENLT